MKVLKLVPPPIKVPVWVCLSKANNEFASEGSAKHVTIYIPNKKQQN